MGAFHLDLGLPIMNNAETAIEMHLQACCARGRNHRDSLESFPINWVVVNIFSHLIKFVHLNIELLINIVGDNNCRL